MSQPTYLQQTTKYQQKFVDDEKDSRYEIEPSGEPTILDFANSPTISRWITHLDDEKTAPAYLFKVDDSASVKYSLGTECATFERTTKDANKNEDGIYEIRFTPQNANVDFSRNSGDRKYCLSIWAFDAAGNNSNHQIEFFWQVVVPPAAMDVNTSRYKAHHRSDDISWLERPAQKIFQGTNPIALKDDLVVGHVVLSNPFSSPISAKLNLTKALDLKIREQSYPVHQNFVAIKYFSYDPYKNEVGEEKLVNDGFVVINDKETVIAKFILANRFQINNIRNPKDRFWRTFSLEIDFQKSGNENLLVDGLTLTTRGGDKDLLLGEYSIPWGNDHDVRIK